jgi:Tol biopolymer transport system component
LGNHRDPVFAPDGTSIIYSGLKEIHYELFELNLQELDISRQLTFGPGNSKDPAISPDGRTVAFSRDHNGYQSIWLQDLGTLDSWQLYGPPLGEGFNPVWSPDGQQLMFLSFYKETPQLYIINIDGTNYKRLSFFLEEFGQEFDWSPTAETLSFSIGKRWYRSIYKFNYSEDLPDDFGSSDGANIIPSLSEDGIWISNNLIPSFSTDGRWMAYVSYPVYMHPDMCEIVIYNLETQEKIQLTDNQYCDYDPDWGP